MAASFLDERMGSGARLVSAERATGRSARPAGETALTTGAALAEAYALGFDLAGVVTEGRSAHMAHLRRWIGAGRHGRMSYLSRPDALARRADLARTLPAFRSAIVVAQSYACAEGPATREGDGDAAPRSCARAERPPKPDAGGSAGEAPAPRRGGRRAGEALVARYARGLDYHGVLTERLHALADRLRAKTGQSLEGRAYVDTGPLLERELAQRAGLGWFGKNTMLIHPRKGSYFFLGVLLTDLPLAASAPFAEDHCGSCRRCLDACPTGALLGRDESGAPVMDATRCISYLTIELKGPVPRGLRPAIGNRVFGCDICQEVCPWNAKFSAPRTDAAYAPRPGFDREPLVRLALRLLTMSGRRFRREFSESAAQRPGRNGLLRNVCIALGNWGSEEAVPALREALEDSAPLVRAHAAWALGRIGTPAAAEALADRTDRETDPGVLEELAVARGPRSGRTDARGTKWRAPV